jgi:cation diffusion facilitator CzcD-associated flavoprotein CzcO
VSLQTTVVVGAGPYGLSAAAHLWGRGLPVAVLGRPMASWERMPAGMLLKSPWPASSLSDPAGLNTLDRFVADTGMPRVEPIPLPYFLEYCAWFRHRAVPQVDTGRVCSLREAPDGNFRLQLADGRALEARRVVVAVGMERFAHRPELFDALPHQLVTHTSTTIDLAGLAGADVAVIGAGQSALEAAALLHEAGARTEVIARGPIHWVDRRLRRVHPALRDLLYAPSDVGPAGLSRVVDRPLLVRRLPRFLRRAATVRAVRPAGAHWLRARVEDAVRLTPHTRVLDTRVAEHGLRLQLSDDSVRYVDRLVLGTGYRPDVRRLDFLAPDLLRRLRTRGPALLLNRWFESSVPRLHFIGALAEHDFGPLCRFVAGAAMTARQVAARAAGG